MSNITRPQMTREEAKAFYELREIGEGCAEIGLIRIQSENGFLRDSNRCLKFERDGLLNRTEKLKTSSIDLILREKKLEGRVVELEKNLHHAVTEGAKTCNKLNDIIQSKDAAISAGHDLLMEESADNSYLVGKINSIHRWYCWSIFTIASAEIASHFIWG